MKLLRVPSSSTNLKCLQRRILERYSHEVGRDAVDAAMLFSPHQFLTGFTCGETNTRQHRRCPNLHIPDLL